MRTPVLVSVGGQPQTRTIGPITQTDVVRFAGAGGDFNPLHHDPEAAASAGFAQPIAMGQMTAGILAAWLTDWCGVEHLRAYEVRFRAPLSLGDTIVLAGTVASIEPIQDGHGLAEVTLTANRGDDSLVSATATVVVSTE
jgi:3-hydroxybutyryl-CoA dehydratase